jgi:hypothetical protein
MFLDKNFNTFWIFNILFILWWKLRVVDSFIEASRSFSQKDMELKSYYVRTRAKTINCEKDTTLPHGLTWTLWYWPRVVVILSYYYNYNNACSFHAILPILFIWNIGEECVYYFTPENSGSLLENPNLELLACLFRTFVNLFRNTVNQIWFARCFIFSCSQLFSHGSRDITPCPRAMNTDRNQRSMIQQATLHDLCP